MIALYYGINSKQFRRYIIPVSLKQEGAADVRRQLSLNNEISAGHILFSVRSQFSCRNMFIGPQKTQHNLIIKVRKLTVGRISAVTEVETKHHYYYRAVCYFCLDEIPRQIQFVSSTLLSCYALYTIMEVPSRKRVGDDHFIYIYLSRTVLLPVG